VLFAAAFAVQQQASVLSAVLQHHWLTLAVLAVVNRGILCSDLEQ
jgi:hypothetical protein